MWVTLKQMDDLGHHLKNASREDILRLLESGLNPFLTRKNLKGDLVPLFFILVIFILVMRLLNTLKKIILEDRFKNPKLFTTPDGVRFISSTHHTLDRKANLSYGEIKDIILNAIDSGSKIHTRVAVPNLMLSRLIRKKYEEIIDEFSKDPNEEKIKFIHKREDNEDEEIFDYIEFIVGRDLDEKNVFNIVSSTFSHNGNYLNLFGKDVVQSRKVMLENYFHFRTVLL
jgi:hypothetical protein